MWNIWCDNVNLSFTGAWSKNMRTLLTNQIKTMTFHSRVPATLHQGNYNVNKSLQIVHELWHVSVSAIKKAISRMTTGSSRTIITNTRSHNFNNNKKAFVKWPREWQRENKLYYRCLNKSNPTFIDQNCLFVWWCAWAITIAAHITPI